METYTSDPVALRVVARYHSAAIRNMPYANMAQADKLDAVAAHKAKLAHIVQLLGNPDISTPEAWRA